MVAPVSPAALIVSTNMPDGPVALPDFIFEMAFFTMSIVIGIGGSFTMSIVIGIGGLLTAVRWTGDQGLSQSQS